MRPSLVALPLVLACQAAPRDCPPPTQAPLPDRASQHPKDGASPSLPSAARPNTAPPSPAPLAAGSLTSPLKQGNQVNVPSSLEEINRWATAAGVRGSLLDWVSAGLTTQNTGTQVDISYVGAEAPVTAVATVTLDGFLDDSTRGERYVLKFSRKACSTCEGGMSGWWLWEMDATRRCHKGRGHEGFAKEPCN